MDFLIYALVYIAAIIVTDLLTPAPDVEGQEARKLGGADFPTASEGRPLPVVFGDHWIAGPNVLWFGDTAILAVTEKACSGTIFKSCTTFAVAHKYFVGMHCGLCHGRIDAFLAIKMGDSIVWEGDSQSATITIDQPALWGGDKSGGGVSGQVDLCVGGFDHGRNDYLVSKLGDEVPAYRGIASAIFRTDAVEQPVGLAGFIPAPTGFYIGTSPVPKPFSFRLRILPTSLSSQYANIDGQANPAHIMFELYTSQAFGCCAAPALMDKEAFMAAAETFYNEGFGLKLDWQNQMEVGDIVSRYEKITDSKIYQDTATGCMTIKLLRNDYDPDTIPVLDESDILQFDNQGASAWHETVNEVLVNYNETTATGNVERIAPAQDLGNLHIQQQQRVSVTLSYPQIPTAHVASMVAHTELKKLSYPLKKGSFLVNRAAYKLTPGSVFKLNRPSRGIEGLIMRVGRWVETDINNGDIQIDAIQDIYGLAETTYATPPPSAWIPPDPTPQDVDYSREDELPYLFSQAPEFAMPWLFVAPPTGTSMDFNLWMGDGEYLNEGDQHPFAKRGGLVTAIDQNATTLTIVGNVALLEPNGDQALGTTVFVLNDELISYGLATDNGNGTWDLTSCERGLLDTVPASHLVGDELWLEVMEEGQRSISTYSPTASVDIKYLTRTASETLDIADATSHGLTFNHRATRPYPPGLIRVSGAGYDGIFASGAAILTWNQRNRLTQNEAMATQSTGTVTPESGTSYTIKIYDHAAVLLRTITGHTGTSYTYTEVDEMADTGLAVLEGQLTFTITTVRDGYESWQPQTITVTRTDTTPS